MEKIIKEIMTFGGHFDLKGRITSRGERWIARSKGKDSGACGSIEESLQKLLKLHKETK